MKEIKIRCFKFFVNDAVLNEETHSVRKIYNLRRVKIDWGARSRWAADGGGALLLR